MQQIIEPQVKMPTMDRLTKYLSKLKATGFDLDEWIDSPIGSLHVDNVNWLINEEVIRWADNKLISVENREYTQDNNGKTRLSSSSWSDFLKRIKKAKKFIANKYKFYNPTNDEVVFFMRTKTFQPYKRKSFDEI